MKSILLFSKAWKRSVMAAERAGRGPPPALTAKEERVVLNLMQQGKSNLAIINHFTTQDMELTLEQVRCARWQRSPLTVQCGVPSRARAALLTPGCVAGAANT